MTNWIKQFKTLNNKQKNELKRKARMVYTNILAQAIFSFFVLYGAMALMDSL
jgi:hypothetical protein